MASSSSGQVPTWYTDASFAQMRESYTICYLGKDQNPDDCFDDCLQLAKVATFCHSTTIATVLSPRSITTMSHRGLMSSQRWLYTSNHIRQIKSWPTIMRVDSERRRLVSGFCNASRINDGRGRRSSTWRVLEFVSLNRLEAVITSLTSSTCSGIRKDCDEVRRRLVSFVSKL